MSDESRTTTLEEVCLAKGMRMTDQRRVIARVLEAATDHPDVEELYRRASAIDSRISIATVYRTVKLFEDAGVIARHDFRAGRSRYETIPDEHHDHLIDLKTGDVIEFRNEEIERLQQAIAKALGFRLVDHRLELYGVPLSPAGRGREQDEG
ncbi:MAG TPA: Fur family transcriptional regulator [Bauldia sp.]|nr:Fur family transcriptional regulator [Bauldia sp.]